MVYLRFRPIYFLFWCLVCVVFLFIDVVFLFMVYLCLVLVYGVLSVFGNTMTIVNSMDCVPRIHHVWRKRNTIGLHMDKRNIIMMTDDLLVGLPVLMPCSCLLFIDILFLY